MSHSSWREMDPEGAAAQDLYIDRCNSLRDKLKNVPLGEFTAGELGSVMRLFRLHTNAAGEVSATDNDLKILEEKEISKKSS